jgi:hypothetical protein
MKRFLLLVISAASVASADERVQWTTEAPPEAADVPAYIGRTADGTRVYADVTTGIVAGRYRAAIYTNVD